MLEVSAQDQGAAEGLVLSLRELKNSRRRHRLGRTLNKSRPQRKETAGSFILSVQDQGGAEAFSSDCVSDVEAG